MKFILAVLVIIGSVFAAYSYLKVELTPVHVTSALAGEVKKTQENVKEVKKELDIHKKDNYLKSLQQRIWTIKERHGETPANRTVKEELTTLEKEKKDTEEYIKEKSK